MRRAWHNGEKVRAEVAGSGAIGNCPLTNWQVKAHVGEIRQYWAYIGGQPELPPGYENETAWHYAWKVPIKDDSCEVIFGENNEHRADIVGNNGHVIELQHSPIDIRDVRERNRFYREETNKRVIWVVDARDYWNKTFKVDFENKDGRNYPINWKNKRQWVYLIAQDPDCVLFLDYKHKSDKLLQVWVHQRNLKCRFILKRDFFIKNMNDVAKDDYKDYTEKCVEIWNEVD